MTEVRIYKGSVLVDPECWVVDATGDVEAEARLIAAAPELLAIAERVAGLGLVAPYLAQDAQDAIAKAKGGMTMARFTVTFETDGAAFDDGYEGRAEVQTVLDKLADRVWESDDKQGLIRDSNGNTIGSWTYERSEEQLLTDLIK